MADLAELSGWSMEFDMRVLKPGEEGHAWGWVARAPGELARFRCDGHVDTGWRPRAEVGREAAAHLLDVHGVTVPWAGPEEATDG